MILVNVQVVKSISFCNSPRLLLHLLSSLKISKIQNYMYFNQRSPKCNSHWIYSLPIGCSRLESNRIIRGIFIDYSQRPSLHLISVHMYNSDVDVLYKRRRKLSAHLCDCSVSVTYADCTEASLLIGIIFLWCSNNGA